MSDYDRNKLFKNYPEDAISALEILMTPELQESLLNLCSVSANFSESVTKETFDYLYDFSKSMSKSLMFKDFSKAIKVFDSIFSRQAIIDIAKGINETFSDIAKINDSVSSVSESSTYDNAEDYVIIESPPKEFEIPDSIAIPAGNKRIRIKTEFLVTILLSIFFGLAGLMQTRYYGQKSLESEKQYYKDQLQAKQDENQILHDFLNSIDASESSQSDSINELVQSIEVLNECLQSSESASQDSDSVHGQVPGTLDNNHE